MTSLRPATLGLTILGQMPLGYLALVVPTPVPNDLDIDLVAFLAKVTDLSPSPVYVPPGPDQTATLTYTLISELTPMRLAGASGLAHRIYQLDLRGTGPAAIAPIAEAIRLAIQGFRGPMGSNTIQAATYKRIPTGFDPSLIKAPGGTFRFAIEVGVWFVQPIPTF